MAKRHSPIQRFVQWVVLLVVACSAGADQGLFTTITAEIVRDNEAVVSGVITPGEAYNIKVTRIPLRDGEVSPPSEQFTPVGATTARLPTSSLYDTQGTARSLRVVAWFDPKYFSIASGREAIVDQGVVTYLWEATQFGKRSSERFKLVVRATAPNGFTDISFLVFAENEQLGELVIPIYVAARAPTGQLRTGRTVSPLRRPRLRETSDDSDFKGAVLTLIELRPQVVQAVFVENERYVTWKIDLQMKLANWAETAGSRLSINTAPDTVAADVQDDLFPESERCLSGNCTKARESFGAWIRKTLSTVSDSRPPLVVQVLPTGIDSLYSPVAAPLGMYPLPGSVNDAEARTIVEDPAKTNVASSGGTVIPGDAVATSSTIAKDPTAINYSSTEKDMGSSVTLVSSQAPNRATDSAGVPAVDPVAEVERLRSHPYLGQVLSIYVPVYRHRVAESETVCVDTWSIYVPPLEPDRENALMRARRELEPLVPRWSAAATVDSNRIVFAENLDGLKQKTIPLKAGLLVVSHFDRGTEAQPHPVLRLEHKGRVHDETVGVAQLRQEFRTPAVVVLLACETGMPPENAFVAKLIDYGAATLIVTTSKIDGKIAGQFAYRFVNALRNNASPGGTTVGSVFHDALMALPIEAWYMIPNFALLGDPEIKVCAPYEKE